jgi:UPF0042 nucleotide-binding protein
MDAERLVLVTGVSGAGKSQAVRALEMLGYTCTDNLPASLLTEFVAVAGRDGGRAAAVIDARGLKADEVPGLLAALRAPQFAHRLIYLDAENDTLVHRFSETRKAHPLDAGGGLPKALAQERALLGELREVADVIDTTGMRVDELVRRVQALATDGRSASGPLPVTITSFGYKYGVPTEADWILDSRFLENPYYIDELRPLTGLDARIRDFVLASPLTAPFLDRTAALVGDLLAGYREWGKPSLLIAIGCTGGRHRSVVLAEELGHRLELAGAAVSVRHRDLAG